MYLLYDTKTGAICGMSTSQPAEFAGYAFIAVPIAPDIDAAYVDGGAVKSRVAMNWTAIPADAFVSINDAAPAKGVTLPATAGTWRYRAVGKYRGDRDFTIQTPQEVEATLIEQVKAEGETRKMGSLTRGFGKDKCYDQKAKEADASGNVLVSVLNALTTTQAMGQYPAAAREAMLTGEQLSVVLKRYRDRVAAVRAQLFTLEAIEQAACRAIRAAPSAAAKRDVQVNWAWQPAGA